MSDSDIFLDDENQSTIEPNHLENIAETVNSLTKWISTVEDKVTLLNDKTDALALQVERNHKESVHLLNSILQATNKQRITKRRVEELIFCNRELALGLSAKLFTSDAKRAKTDPKLIPKETLHPSVMSFVFVEDDEDDKEEEK
jgi:hypothetical protein